MSTCRVCKISSWEHTEEMYQYSTRHYAHLSCGLNRWGIKFLDDMRPWRLGNLSFVVLRQYGLLDMVNSRYAEYLKEFNSKREVSA